jgi:uncharacterized coiled-coil protein SlyX
MNFLKRISELERQVAALKLNVQQLLTEVRHLTNAVIEIQAARINELARKKPGPKPKEQK